MAITMQYIYETYKESFALHLLAGEEGMNGSVSWVYYSEDPETTSFLYGNELIITTGVAAKTSDWLLMFCKSLIENHAAGLIVNTGAYIPSVPEEVIAYCEARQFPLLSMPWEIHIIDVSRGICGKIQEKEKTEFILSTAFHNAIFYPSAKHVYESILIRQGFLPEDSYYTVCVHTDLEQPKRMLRDLEETFRLHEMKFCGVYGSEEIILIICDCPEEKIKEVLKEFLKYMKTEYERMPEIHFGIGCRTGSFYTLNDSYEKAHACVLQAARQKQSMLCFSELGLKKLLLCIQDPSLLQHMIDETIGPILTYDHVHQTEYLKVLRMYIETDSGIQEIANTLFMHRNTINYRIGKIKEILQKDLSSMEEKVLFQTAFYILDLYGPEPGKTLN